MTSYSTLTIPPTSAQIGDSANNNIAYDGITGGGEFVTDAAAPSPSSSNSTSSSVNWGLIGAATAGAVVVGGIGYYFYSNSKKNILTKSVSFFLNQNQQNIKPSLQVNEKNKRGYQEVPRYERFTTDF